MPRLRHHWLDDSEYPVLRVTSPEDYSLEQYTEMLRDVEAFYRTNNRPFAWVVDATLLNVSDAQGRKLTAEHEARWKEHTRLYNCGTAFVIQTAWVRGIVTAIFWISPPAYPYQVFSNVAAARAWAYAQVTARLGSGSGAGAQAV